jgi:hypothetical protein
MESDSTNSEISPSLQNNSQDNSPLADVFVLTREDTGLLLEYVNKFEQGDLDMRSTIIANAMAELVMLQPAGALFDKDEATKVRSALLILS